jgi:hypothetical protein
MNSSLGPLDLRFEIGKLGNRLWHRLLARWWSSERYDSKKFRHSLTCFAVTHYDARRTIRGHRTYATQTLPRIMVFMRRLIVDQSSTSGGTNESHRILGLRHANVGDIPSLARQLTSSARNGVLPLPRKALSADVVVFDG